jgi:hypothetical protein
MVDILSSVSRSFERSSSVSVHGPAQHQAHGSTTPLPLDDQTQTHQAVFDCGVVLFIDLTACCSTQRLPRRLVVQGAAVTGEHLQQQISQVFIACFWGGESRSRSRAPGCLCPSSPLGLGFARYAAGAQTSDTLRWTTARLAHMSPVLPRCINCQNFSGCKGKVGVCRVWQALLPPQVAATNCCEHWTALSVK